MVGQLYIRHDTDANSAFIDVYSTFGAIMGEDFISSVDGAVPLKDMIQFSSRVADGRQVRTSGVHSDSRDVTLNFVIFGSSASDYRTKKNAFLAYLQADPCIGIKVPPVLGDSWCAHLIYTGKSVTYSESFSHCRGTIAAKFIEPDPTDRTISVKSQEYLVTEQRNKLMAGTAFLIP